VAELVVWLLSWYRLTTLAGEQGVQTALVTLRLDKTLISVFISIYMCCVNVYVSRLFVRYGVESLLRR
jgi:hypothetical protein